MTSPLPPLTFNIIRVDDLFDEDVSFLKELSQTTINYFKEHFNVNLNLTAGDESWFLGGMNNPLSSYNPGYEPEQAPQNSLYFVHGNMIGGLVNFAGALDLSRKRPDLRFIVRAEESPREFRGWKEISAGDSIDSYLSLRGKETSPRLPVSLTDLGVYPFFGGDFDSDCPVSPLKTYLSAYMKILNRR